MHTPTPRTLYRIVACILLILSAGNISAQSAADQSFKTIPQQVKTSAETKATTKTNTVSNNALNKVDSASDKAFKGFTGLFRKKAKNKPPQADSTKVHPPDSTAIAKP